MNQHFQSPLLRNAQEHKEEGKIYVLTKNELLRLDGDELIPLKKLERTYSKLSWDGSHFYLLAYRISSTPQVHVESKLVILDAKLNKVGSYKAKDFLDFDVKNGIVYALVGDKLLLLDVNTLTKITDVEFMLGDNPFGKQPDNIIVKDHYAYILDDIVAPFLVGIVDVSDSRHPIEYTKVLGGTNSELIAQDVEGDHWIVLEAQNLMGGYNQYLHDFSAKPDELMTFQAPLYEFQFKAVEGEPEMHISSIKMQDGILYSLGYGAGAEMVNTTFPHEALSSSELRALGFNSLKFSMFSLPWLEPVRRINTFQQAVYAQIESGQIVGSKAYTEEFLGLKPFPKIIENYCNSKISDCIYNSEPTIYNREPTGSLTKLALLDLHDSGYPTNIVLLDSKAYVGGKKGVYVIDVSTRDKPMVSQFIRTDSPVRYLLTLP